MNTSKLIQPGSHDSEIVSGGVVRTFSLYVPDEYTNPVPLVFVLHGATGTGRRVSVVSGFSDISTDSGFIVVYPDGEGGYWKDGRVRQETTDVTFISDLIEHFTDLFDIDERRIYAAGVSNGGMMALRLACELSDKIAAVASVAGPLPEKLAVQCSPVNPVSVLLFHGTEDEFLPYNGGRVPVRGGGSILSAQKTAEKWAELNGCNREPRTTLFPKNDPADDTSVRRELYTGSDSGAEVVLYTILEGGHTWPSGNGGPERVLGRTTREINATRIIWEFFEQHPRT